jgi:hypothetical protein
MLAGASRGSVIPMEDPNNFDYSPIGTAAMWGFVVW